MAAVFAFHTDKAVVQIAAIKVTINDLLHIWPGESILLLESLFVNVKQRFKNIFYAVIIISVLWMAWPVYAGRFRHDILACWGQTGKYTTMRRAYSRTYVLLSREFPSLVFPETCKAKIVLRNQEEMNFRSSQ